MSELNFSADSSFIDYEESHFYRLDKISGEMKPLLRRISQRFLPYNATKFKELVKYSTVLIKYFPWNNWFIIIFTSSSFESKDHIGTIYVV